MKKIVLSAALVGLSVAAYGGPATDAFYAARARYQATCSNGHDTGNSADCRAAFQAYQAASSAMQQEAWSSVQQRDNERMRVQQEEMWRQQMRGR